MNLRVEPVRKLAQPRYPTNLEILADPKLLEQHVPLSWLGNREIATALTVILAAGSAGCSDTPAARVAPVFRHGLGRGATGCIVAAPPVFLSEEEARQVINEELTSQGLALTEKGVLLPLVQVLERGYPNYSERNKFRYTVFGRKLGFKQHPGTGEPLRVDLRDPGKRVAVEFVSHEDYYKLGGVRGMLSVQSFDMAEVAEYVCSQVLEKEREKSYFGCFYDPIAERRNRRDFANENSALDRDQLRNAWAEECKQESSKLLREQVKDFADWLKAQAVI